MEERYLLNEWKALLSPYAHSFETFNGKDEQPTVYAQIRVNGIYCESHISFFEKWYCIGAEKSEEGWSDCLDYNDQNEFNKVMKKVMDYLGLEEQAVQLTLF